MQKRIKSLIIGLGNIGLYYDYFNYKKSYRTHSSTINNHINYDLLCGIDLKKKNRIMFEKKYLKKTYSSLDLTLKEKKFDLIIISYDCKNFIKLILKILSYNHPKFILFEKPFVKNLDEFIRVKKILIKNKINFSVNFQRYFNKIYLNSLKKVFKEKNNKKIIINYSGDFLSNAVHFLFMLVPFIKNIKEVNKYDKVIIIKSDNLEIIFINLDFNYSSNKMEIYTHSNAYILSGRNEKFDVFIKSADKSYKGVNILKKKNSIYLNSNLNQKIVFDNLSKTINNSSETLNFCKLYEKYLSILGKILK